MTGFQGTPQARLVSRLNVQGPDECWLWTGAVTKRGYAQMKYIDGLAMVHRVAYEVFVGPVPADLDVDHECHNRAVRKGECSGGPECKHRLCCNPWHLVPRTRRDNLDGGVNSHVNTELCVNGHPNSEYRRRAPGGQTYCRKCRAEYRAAQRVNERLRSRERRQKSKKVQLEVRPVPQPKESKK